MIKDEVVRIRVNPAEKLALQAVACAERRNMSEVIRDAIRERAVALGVWPPPPPPPGTRQERRAT